VILDGENCWEYYPDGGVRFLRALYRNCIQNPQIRPQRVRDYLKDQPATDRIGSLFAGSWISHNFAIWIGHHEDNTAWDLLHQTREFLKQTEAEGKAPKEALAKAWEELFIAEGSDWYWWFGDDHSSAQDALFDYLIRKHLQNVYLLLGDTPPAELGRPIRRRGQKAIHTVPRSFLDVKIDGRESFFEWICAGRYECHNERGTMAMVTQGPLREVYFGFDLEELFVRVDLDAPARTALTTFDAVRIGFVEPAGWEVLIEHPTTPQHNVRLLHQGEERPLAKNTIAVGIDRILELSIPFALLGIEMNQPIQFFVEIVEGGQSRDRAPREGAIHLTCPAPDFEQIMWDV
jgi:hypothetical protein